MERDLIYENDNIAYDENGNGIKCKNYELCEAILPPWWFECKLKYLCTNCDMMFGSWIENSKEILKFNDDIECPICLQVSRGISHPRCIHSLCIMCFKRCHYGDNSGEPTFPYTNIQAEYDDDQENPKWKTDYPLIDIYNQEWNKWTDEKYEKYENEKNLRQCPICRK
jgi:hypothetical protein